MNAEERRPCEHAVYIHYFIGGAMDGYSIPSNHCYEASTIDGVTYRRTSEPSLLESPPDGLQVINCTDDYMEQVFFRVDMEPSQS